MPHFGYKHTLTRVQTVDPFIHDNDKVYGNVLGTKGTHYKGTMIYGNCVLTTWTVA